MSEINFLHSSFVTRRVARRRFVHVAMVCGVLTLLVGGGFVVERGRVRALQEQVRTLESQSGDLAAKKIEVAVLRTQIDKLRKQQRVQWELVQPVSKSQVLATLSEVMPPGVMIRSLVLDQVRPALKTPDVEAGKRRGRNDNAPPVDPRSQQMAIAIGGIGPSGTELTNLIGVLEQHPLFESIKMTDSKSAEADGVLFREFQLKLAVPLNRDYRPSLAEVIEPPATETDEPNSAADDTRMSLAEPDHED